MKQKLITLITISFLLTTCNYNSNQDSSSNQTGENNISFPISFYKDKRNRRPHLNTWRDGWRHLKFLLLYSPTHLFLAPGLAFMVLGFLLMLILFRGPVQVGGIVFDTHSSLLGSLLAILGYQLVLMGIQARVYAQTQPFKFKDSFIENFYRIFTVERGLILGALLFLTGFILDGFVVYEWIQAGYKNLSEANLLALTSTLMLIGIQTLFESFFLGILRGR